MGRITYTKEGKKIYEFTEIHYGVGHLYFGPRYKELITDELHEFLACEYYGEPFPRKRVKAYMVTKRGKKPVYIPVEKVRMYPDYYYKEERGY